MKQIGIQFGANYFRNSDNVNKIFCIAKARIREQVAGASNQDGDIAMPMYLKAKNPEDGWIRVVRKIMERLG